MTPTDAIDGAELYQGDSLAVLPALPPASFDLVATDPPYSSGGLYRGDRAGRGSAEKYVRGSTASAEVLTDFTGDNRDQLSYLYWCALWLGQCLRLTKPGGVCCLFTDWRQLPATTTALQAGGWVWRGIVPWDKTEAARPAKGRFRNQCEYVVWGSNGGMGAENDQGDTRPCLPGFVRQSTVGMDKEHSAQKPLHVMRELVRIAPAGGRVLDPFMGSGSTVLAALQAGLTAVGIELSAEHYATALARVTGAGGGPKRRPPGLFG